MTYCLIIVFLNQEDNIIQEDTLTLHQSEFMNTYRTLTLLLTKCNQREVTMLHLRYSSD